MIRLGITGHQEIPSDIEEYVKTRLNILVRDYDEVTGIGSLAAGADQLFATTVLSHGGTIEVIIPAEDYRTTFTEDSSARNYDALLAKAATVTYLSFIHSSEEAYMAAGQEVVRQCQQLIAIWDGKPSRGKGGTADVVAFAKRQGVIVTIIWPQGRAR